MSQAKKQTTSEDLMASLMAELNLSVDDTEDGESTRISNAEDLEIDGGIEGLDDIFRSGGSQTHDEAFEIGSTEATSVGSAAEIELPAEEDGDFGFLNLNTDGAPQKVDASPELKSSNAPPELKLIVNEEPASITEDPFKLTLSLPDDTQPLFNERDGDALGIDVAGLDEASFDAADEDGPAPGTETVIESRANLFGVGSIGSGAAGSGAAGEEATRVGVSFGHPASAESSEKTVALNHVNYASAPPVGDGERTVEVAGFLNRATPTYEDKVKISVGQSGNAGSGYGNWGSTDSNLAQAENLKMAQSKILDLERENEKLRLQNEELISASEIIKERSELLTAQVYEYKNDRESLEISFKNEMGLVKSQLNRKDTELLKSQMKIDDLDSRLKFDMKKIRVRERELENRLELIRAEKNALVRSKDEQILDSRRKIDQLQMEVDSFRQKCSELNRIIEANHESSKRTTRALRLAMANLELQDENKSPLKKVD